jgi:hypothetical protein
LLAVFDEPVIRAGFFIATLNGESPPPLLSSTVSLSESVPDVRYRSWVRLYQFASGFDKIVISSTLNLTLY